MIRQRVITNTRQHRIYSAARSGVCLIVDRQRDVIYLRPGLDLPYIALTLKSGVAVGPDNSLQGVFDISEDERTVKLFIYEKVSLSEAPLDAALNTLLSQELEFQTTAQALLPQGFDIMTEAAA